MAFKNEYVIRRQLQTLFNLGTIGDLTDGQLLERFATDRGEGGELAFAALVERHGPMVLRVCRSVLADPNDAQDAFQATFLVLVRKARSLWVRDTLGPWLHQVSYRTALYARSTAARRQRHEKRAAVVEARCHAVADDEPARLLHEEIDRLPERFRKPLVLCELEGNTHEQAARLLNWPIGTVKSRLSRGRDRLRARLTRRGLAPDASLLAACSRFELGQGSVPQALIDATTSSAVQFLTARSVVQGSATYLAKGVLKAMLLPRTLAIASVILVGGAATSGLAMRGQGGAPSAEDSASNDPIVETAAQDMPVHVTKRGPFRIKVEAPGRLESSQNLDVVSKVEGTTTIVSIVPEGTAVKKGDLVAELDSAALRDRLVNQRITAQRAEADVEESKADLFVAEMAYKEYMEGTQPQQEMTLREEVSVLKSSLERAQARLDRTKQARDRLAAIMEAKQDDGREAEILAQVELDDRVDAAELGLERAQLALKLGESEHKIQQKYTRHKMARQLQTSLERALAQMSVNKATWELEKQKVENLERQIDQCKLYSPGDGTLVYSSERTADGWPVIKEGVKVQERQMIFSVPDFSQLRVNARVGESMVDRVQPGQKVQIQLKALPSQRLAGVVQNVAPSPDLSYLSLHGAKIYPTLIEIENLPPDLRPRMPVTVDILVDSLDEVLTVPIQAVVPADARESGRVVVKLPDGSFEGRTVTLGKSDGKVVEVKSGLKSGESVLLEPLKLSIKEEKRSEGNSPTNPNDPPG